jgi:hypothetical protein
MYEEGRYFYNNMECVELQLNNHYYNSDLFILLQDEFEVLRSEDAHEN